MAAEDDYVRLFDLEDAIALLPHVIETMAIIRENKRRLDELNAEMETLPEQSGSNGHSNTSKREVLRTQAMLAGAMVEAKMANLRGMGIEVKGIEPGLVDFPSEREGRVVYLCWRDGEETISFWHEIDAGFAGRQEL